MHKSFYASGFLYHAASQQILLQQQTSVDSNPTWSLLGDSCKATTDHLEQFQQIIRKTLKVSPPKEAVHAVYDYCHRETGENHFVLFVEVADLKDFSPSEGRTFAWFSFAEIAKLGINKSVLQDIIVGQRVINALDRKRTGERYIE